MLIHFNRDGKTLFHSPVYINNKWKQGNNSYWFLCKRFYLSYGGMNVAEDKTGWIIYG